MFRPNGEKGHEILDIGNTKAIFLFFQMLEFLAETGHDYNNFWEGDLFNWESKTKSNIGQTLIQ